MFIANTPEEQKAMLEKVGVSSIEELLAQIPSNLRSSKFDLPKALTEQELTKHLQGLASKNKPLTNFIGAGIYEHFIPAAVGALSSRGEFLTAYTPYQAEASQGTLQTIYEFQSCICSLFDMDVATASHYDGATALAEAICATVRITNRKEILIPASLHPHYKQVINTYLRHFEDTIVTEIPFSQDGSLDKEFLKAHLSANVACCVLAMPNFFGSLEDADAISSLTHDAGALLVALVNPLSLGVLRTPGSYHADFAVAEGQCLGNAMNFGGPGLGIMTAKKEYVRQLPGRIVGIAKDKNGKRSFVLTLQAREQHIRREKAASNICSNEALCALNSVIYLTLLGPKGLEEVASINVERSHQLAAMIASVPGYKLQFSSPFFNEFVVSCPISAKEVIQKMAEQGIAAGYALEDVHPSLKNCLLVCATEMRTQQDLDLYVKALRGI